MNRLIIVRHGIAVAHGTPGVPEDDRPLTSQGERRTRQIARGLDRLGLKFDRIVTSPLRRARETAEILAEVLDAEDRLEEADALRAENGAATIREWLGGRAEDRLMIVGHDPSLTDLLTLLVTGQPGPALCNLRKGGVAALAATPSGDKYLIDWLARPRLMRRLA